MLGGLWEKKCSGIFFMPLGRRLAACPTPIIYMPSLMCWKHFFMGSDGDEVKKSIHITGRNILVTTKTRYSLMLISREGFHIYIVFFRACMPKSVMPKKLVQQFTLFSTVQHRYNQTYAATKILGFLSHQSIRCILAKTTFFLLFHIN